MKVFHRANLLSFCLLVFGCGSDESKLPLQKAKGELTINVKVPTGAIIGLHPVTGDFDEQGTRPAGKVMDDGFYIVSTYAVGDGAPIGEYKASIIWPQFPSRDDPGADRMKGKYSSPETSTLIINVREGVDVLEPITLEYVSLLPGK